MHWHPSKAGELDVKFGFVSLASVSSTVLVISSSRLIGLLYVDEPSSLNCNHADPGQDRYAQSPILSDTIDNIKAVIQDNN